MTNILRAKLLVVGDSAVGKTSIVQQFLNSGTGFPKNYSMTLGADVVTRTINIPDTSDAVELVFIDCTGKTINNDILQKVKGWRNESGHKIHIPTSFQSWILKQQFSNGKWKYRVSKTL